MSLIAAPTVWRSRAAGWFEQRSERERLLVAAALVLGLCVLFFFLVWRPIDDARTAAREEIRADEAVIARLRVAGPQLAARGAVRTGAPATLITATAAEASLTIRRLEPSATGAVVALEDVEYDKVVRWLADLERQSGLRVSELKIDRRPPPGVINAQITLVGR
jgi:general secretion pathway protein M